MAYDLQREVLVVQCGAMSAAADIGSWNPGYQPVVIRAVAVVLRAIASSGGVVKVDKRPTVGSDTSRGDGDVATVTIPNAQAAGTVVYSDQLNVKVSPGEEIVAEVTDAFGTFGDVIVLVEPAFENPANNTDMSETA